MKPKPKIPLNKLFIPFVGLGLAAIVFFKIMENSGIEKLVERNIDLVSELDLHNRLQAVEGQSRRVDASLRNLFRSKDIKPNDEIGPQVKEVKDQLDSIKINFLQGTDGIENKLAQIFTDRSNTQEQILVSYNAGNKNAAEATFNSDHAKLLRDSANYYYAKANEEHRRTSLKIADSIRDNGSDVHNKSIAFVVVACLMCLFVCFYLVKKKKQSEMSEKRVKAAASVKENFLANMSHEIRTPLNTILGFANILQKSGLDTEQQKHMQIIQTSGNNLLSIVNDILDLSKIEAGMMRIEQAPFRVAEVMGSVEEMLSQKAEEKKLKLIVKIDDEIPDTLGGDAVRLTQVLMNLVSNSIKFTNEGGVYVRVTPFKKDGDVMQLEFLVRDTGIGIPKEKQNHIFERFEQAEAATTRRFGGTGLGLSIVKHLIDLQGGTITVSSEPGYGTSFLVVLPYKLTNEQAPTLTVAKQKSDNSPTMDHSINILVAEDNTLNQHLMRHLLKTWGFKFEIVGNGLLAFEAVRSQKYDLVLMDIQMPEMDGHTATRMIRSEAKSKIPIIAMTAHAMEGEREKCLASGMDDYISKPLDEKKLYTLITHHGKVQETNAANSEKPVAALASIARAKVINLQYVDEIAGGDPNFRNDIIREFVEQVPTKIHTLERAIQTKDFNTIRSIAHEMKTTVHFLGLSNLIGHLLQQIEDLAKAKQSLMSIEQMFQSIKLVCTQAVAEAHPLVA